MGPKVRALSGVLLLWAGAACIHPISDDEDGRRSGAIADDCLVPAPAGANIQGAPRSIEYPYGSLLVFGDAAAFVSGAGALCAGNLEFHPLIALTQEEADSNAARTDGRRLGLVVRTGVVRGTETVVFFDRMLFGPGIFDVKWMGRGACLLSSRDGLCRRDPQLEIDASSSGFGLRPEAIAQSAIADGDGNVDLYACFHAAAFSDLCTMSRAPLSEAEKPGAYRAEGFGGPTDDPTNAAAILSSSGPLSVAKSAFFGQYIFVETDIFTPRVDVLRSPSPSGPFSTASHLFHPVPPKTFFVAGGVLHAGLAEEGGRVIAVSYANDQGLHLVRFRFDLDAKEAL